MSFLPNIAKQVRRMALGTRTEERSDFDTDNNRCHSSRISPNTEPATNECAIPNKPARKIAAATCTAALALTGMGTAVLSYSTFPETAEAGSISRSGKSYYGGYSTSHFSIGGKTAFCIQPSKRGPYSYGSWSWATSNSKLCAAMYFGVSGPGFNYAKSHGWWPKKNWNGSAMSWNDYYACTHVLLSYIYGGKASALYGTNRTFQNWANANILGTLYKNISANAWQINPTYKKGVWIAYTGGRYQDMICAENYTYDGGLRIFKKDSATGKGMARIKFNIYTSDKNGKKGSYVKQVTTDAYGYAYTGELELPRGYYRAYEVNPPSGYKAVWTNTVYVKGDGTRQTATAVNSKTTSFTARKNFVGTPRSGAKITLLRNGAAYSSKILSASSQNVTWTNLPYHDSRGNAYKYTVREDNISSGYVLLGGVRYRSVQVGNTITNTETTTHTVTKTWNDLSTLSSDWRYRRPSSLKVQLVRTLNGGGRTVVGNATLTASNNWSYTWRDLPRTDSSNRAYTYSAVEVPDAATSKNYTVSYSYSGTKTTITNVLAKKDISVKKQWIYKDGNKPASVSFELYVGLVKVATQSMPVSALSATDTMAFKGLPKYDKSGNEIRYTVREIVPAGWKPISNDISTTGTASFTNVSTESIDIPVEKKWNGADTEGAPAVPSSIEVKLLVNGVENGKTLILSAASDWKGSFAQLPRYDSAGREITYTISEVEVENWESKVTGSAINGFVISNTPMTPVKFIKKWTGGDFSNIPTGYRADILDGIVVDIKGLRQNGLTDSWAVEIKGDMNETGDTIWETTSNIPLVDIDGVAYKSFEVSERDDLSALKDSLGRICERYYVSSILGSIEEKEIIVTNIQHNRNEMNFSVNKIWDTTAGGHVEPVEIDIMKAPLKEIDEYFPNGPLFEFDSTSLKSIDWGSLISSNNITVLIHADVSNFASNISTLASTLIVECDGDKIVQKNLNEYNFSSLFLTLQIDVNKQYSMYIEARSETHNEEGNPDIDIVNWNFPCSYYCWQTDNNGIPAEPTLYKTVELNDNNGWSYSEKLDQLSIYYPVEHDLGDIDDGRFICSYSANGEAIALPDTPENMSSVISCINGLPAPQYNYTATNTFAKENIDIPVRKVWNDEENLAGIRPDSIEVKLYKHLKGKNTDADRELAATAVLNEENDWQYTFEQMKAWDAITGDIWVYEIEEEQVLQYDAPQISGSYLKGFVIENNLALTSVGVDKEWNDLDDTYGMRPDSITVHVLANGEVVENKELVLNEDNGWKGSFVGLPVYDADGNVIAYTVEEVTVDGYDSDVTYSTTGSLFESKPFATLDVDGNFRMYKRAVRSSALPQVGNMWNDGSNSYIVEKVYLQNFENPVNANDVPEWCSDQSLMITANVIDMGIAPTSTFQWFAGQKNLKSVNLTKLDTSNTTSMYRMFYGCTILTSLNLNNFRTNNVTNMGEMFSDCTSLKSIDVSGFDTSNVIYMDRMFYNCTSLTSLNIINFKTNNVTNMSYMFYNCNNLTSLDVSRFNTEKVIYMDGMFTRCSKLTSLDVSKFDTRQVTTMNGTFSQCAALTSLDVSGFKTNKVTNMRSMFYGCAKLSSLNVSGFDTSHVTTMEAMFASCSALATLNVSNFNTSNVTTMSSMFFGCSNLSPSLDLSKWNTSNVTSMYAMFASCAKIQKIYVSTWNMSKVASSTSMFTGCSSLRGGKNTPWNSSHIDGTYARVDGGPSSSTPGYFTYKAAPVATAATASINTDVAAFAARTLSSSSTVPKLPSSLASAATGSANSSLLSLSSVNSPLYDDDIASSNESNNMLTLSPNAVGVEATITPAAATAVTLLASGTVGGNEVAWEIDADGNMRIYPVNGSNGTITMTGSVNKISWGWNSYRSQIKTVTFEGSIAGNGSMKYMFYNCSALTSLDVSEFDTSSVTSMYCMFNGCSKLSGLDVSGWNTSKVTDMGNMFYKCSGLLSLDLSGFDTSSVTYMDCMFYDCSSLSSLNLSKWNTSSVTNMGAMFYNCSSLSSLDLSGWNTSKVTNMINMFYKCSGLLSLDLSGFDTSQVTSIGSMFSGCSSLSSLDMSGWDTSKVTSMVSMFSGCSSLSGLDVSGFDTSKVTSMGSMFRDCSSLSGLDLGGFDTSKVTSMDSMFRDCSSLSGLDVSGFDTSSVTSMYCMFNGCSKLSGLDVSGWNTSKVTDMCNMFSGCFRLSDITLSPNFVICHITNNSDLPTFPTPDGQYADYPIAESKTWISKNAQQQGPYTSEELLAALLEAGTDTQAFAGTWEWGKPSYSLSFVLNGASGTVEDVDWYIGDIDNHVLPDASGLYLIGNRFMGWSTSEDGSAGLLQPGKCQQELGSEGDEITLYAIWQDLTEPIPAHITNTLKERSIEITKKWDTYSTNPPSSITVHLSRAGATYDVTLNEENGWSTKIDHLPVFDSNGKEYSYSVYESSFDADTDNNVLGSDSYEMKIEGDALNGFVLTNIEKRHIPVSKIWSDYDDADGLRPDEITIELYRMETIDSTSETSTSPDESNAAALPDAIDGYYWKKIDSINLSDANNWAHTFDDLPRYDADGMEYSYYVSEVPLAPELSYTALISGTQDTGFVVNNVHDRIYKELYVSKQWRDDDNRDKVRPSSVTVHLQQNGANYGDPIVLSDSNSWTASTGLVPIYDKNGQAYKYSFVEDAVEGYKSSINRDASNVDAYVVTNSHTPTTRSVEVEKTFFSVPAGIELTPVTVHLMQNGKRMEGDAYTAVLSKDTKWKHVFDLLPIYDENGNEYIYTVDEDRVDDYVSIMTGNQEIGFTITNYCTGGLSPDGSPEAATITIPLTKIWEDDGNADRTRPDSVTVHLYCDYGKWNENTGEHKWKEVTSIGEGNLPSSPRTITEDDGVWKTSWSGLPSGEFVDSGNGDYEFIEYSYKITEDPCPGYEISDAISDGNGGFVLTNTKTVETSVTKKWVGDDEGQRPASIDATLMRTRYSNAAECSNLYVLYDKATRTEIGRFDDLNEALDSDNTMRVYPYAINNTGNTHAMLAMDGTVSGNVHITAYASSTVENDDGTIDESTSVAGAADLSIPASDKTAKMFHDFGKIPDDGELSFTITDDSGNDLGKHVMSFMLYGDETIREPMDKLTLSAANNWCSSVTGLYTYDVRGLPQQWSLEEADCYGYTSSFQQGEAGELVLTNTLIDHISVNKQWIGDIASERPGSVEMELLANNVCTGQKITLSAANNWSGEFDGIRWRDGSGNEIAYTVEETVPAGYEARMSGAASISNNYTVTVTNIPTVDIPVSKIWSGDEGHEDVRPASIEASLTARASMMRDVDLSLDSELDNVSTAYDVSSLFDDASDAIKQMLYIYDSLSSVKLELVSTHATDVSFYLNLFDGNIQKSSIFVEMPANSTKTVELDAGMLSSMGNPRIESAAFAENDTGLYDIAANSELSATLLTTGSRNAGTIALSNDNNWSDTFAGLSQIDVLGNAVTYSVREVTDVPGYSSMVTGTPSKGYVIDNAYALDDVPVRKIWSDMDDRDGYRPEYVKVALFEVESTSEEGEEILGNKVGEVVLSDDNNWQSNFAHIKTHNDAGHDIAFTVREVDDAGNPSVPEHYAAKISGDAISGFTVTNVHEVLMSLSVEKIWDDGGNENMKRPYSIMFHVYRNSVSEENEVANSIVEGDMYEDTWSCEFGNLPYADEDGNAINYIVTEDAISNYTTNIDATEDGAILVTNHTDYTKFYELPLSGSSGIMWIVLSGMGMLLVAFGAVLRREAKKSYLS